MRMVLTYDAYTETIEEKQIQDKEVENLRNQMASMQEAQREILDLLKDPAKLVEVLKKSYATRHIHQVLLGFGVILISPSALFMCHVSAYVPDT